MHSVVPKILVADDSMVVHQTFKNAFQAGPKVRLVHAFDGMECLDALDQGMDIAFIDVSMSKINGMDALWAARIAGNKTFVTLITGQPSPRCIELAQKLDAYELLVKPFANLEIGSIIRTFQRISAPLKVLLVDDSNTLLKIMRKVLRKSIFRLQIDDVSEGTAALNRCHQTAFDVVFLDINMPGLNGLETLSRMTSTHPHPKVVMMSSEHNMSREREAMQLGASVILHKPFFPTEIDAALHELFGLRSPKLARHSQLLQFETNIQGRTVAVRHNESGHVYKYAWFSGPPHLRFALTEQSASAEIPAVNLAPDAEKIALLELQAAGLLNTRPNIM